MDGGRRTNTAARGGSQRERLDAIATADYKSLPLVHWKQWDYCIDRHMRLAEQNKRLKQPGTQVQTAPLHSHGIKHTLWVGIRNTYRCGREREPCRSDPDSEAPSSPPPTWKAGSNTPKTLLRNAQDDLSVLHNPSAHQQLVQRAKQRCYLTRSPCVGSWPAFRFRPACGAPVFLLFLRPLSQLL